MMDDFKGVEFTVMDKRFPAHKEEANIRVFVSEYCDVLTLSTLIHDFHTLANNLENSQDTYFVLADIVRKTALREGEEETLLYIVKDRDVLMEYMGIKYALVERHLEECIGSLIELEDVIIRLLGMAIRGETHSEEDYESLWLSCADRAVEYICEKFNSEGEYMEISEFVMSMMFQSSQCRLFRFFCILSYYANALIPEYSDDTNETLYAIDPHVLPEDVQDTVRQVIAHYFLQGTNSVVVATPNIDEVVEITFDGVEIVATSATGELDEHIGRSITLSSMPGENSIMMSPRRFPPDLQQ
jgi:hypothetical protein